MVFWALWRHTGNTILATSLWKLTLTLQVPATVSKVRTVTEEGSQWAAHDRQLNGHLLTWDLFLLDRNSSTSCPSGQRIDICSRCLWPLWKVSPLRNAWTGKGFPGRMEQHAYYRRRERKESSLINNLPSDTSFEHTTQRAFGQLMTGSAEAIWHVCPSVTLSVCPQMGAHQHFCWFHKILSQYLTIVHFF